MLNGIAPIFIFTISPIPAVTTALSGIPLLDELVGTVGIPIPIYLDERFTGIYVTNEEKSIDINNEILTANASNPKVYQKPLDSMVTINLVGRKDSVALVALIALSDLIFSKLKNGYGISYLNGPTTIFNGLLKTFSTHTSNEDDLIRVTIQLSDAKKSVASTVFRAAESTTTIGAEAGAVESGVSGGANGGNITVPESGPVFSGPA